MGDARIDIASRLSQQTVKADDQVGTDTQCVIRIPDHLRNEKPKAFLPMVVSLGPFHYVHSEHATFETLKINLLSQTHPNRDRLLEDLVHRIGSLESRIRRWYHPYDCKELDSSKLGLMMIQDGLFLLQFLRQISLDRKASVRFPHSSARFRHSSARFTDSSARFSHPSGRFSHSSARFIQPILQPFAVQEDIMKLENQIPMFVVHVIREWEATTYQKLIGAREAGTDQKMILDLEAGTDEDPIAQCEAQAEAGDLNSILSLAWQTLSPFRCTLVSQESQVLAGVPLRLGSHLLEFVYENIIRTSHSTDHTKHNRVRGKRMNQKKRGITLPRATELKRRGMNFAAHEGLLSEIRFDRGTCTLHLPTVEVDDRADAVMRNLLAFEAYVYKGKEKPLRCYVDLMDRLINRDDDVELLRNEGIIYSNLGTDEEVAGLFNGMGKNLEMSKYEPIDTAIVGVLKFYTSKYRIMWAEFKKKYLSKPWLIVALIGGFISLFLSVLQTILAWEQYCLQIESNKTQMS